MSAKKEGDVVIRTGSGDISDSDRYFKNDILLLMERDPDWFVRVAKTDDVFAGPFCYTWWERELPF